LRILHSSQFASTPVNPEIVRSLASISESHLRELVETIAIPRDFSAQPRNNRRIAEWLFAQLDAYGYRTSFQGQWMNVVALPKAAIEGELILVGAHYDSVSTTPGADDNASAVAALLACAKAVAEHAPDAAICFVAFNREEDGFIGSTDFVENYLPESGLRIRQVHILEMIGYCRHQPGSQQIPAGLPINIPDTGDFLGVLGNSDSNAMIDPLLQGAKTYLPTLPVIGLKVYLGLENHLPVLGLSDHVPFWQAGIPALMWTDTAEFRNPNYHRQSDTPDSLDYSFLGKISQLLLAHLLVSVEK
jgi:Zn-dependent M28 family amino/carboxypeptidase